jgi:hypothetical protein
MKPGVSLALVTMAILSPTVDAVAQGTPADALGGPVIACPGTISWAAETDGGTPRDEPMTIAVRDDPGADRIALFVTEADFVAEDVWACESGFCTSSRVTERAVTTNVLRLSKRVELGDGQVEYGLSVVFSVVSAGEDNLEPAQTSGQGRFVCAKLLPPGIAAK